MGNVRMFSYSECIAIFIFVYLIFVNLFYSTLCEVFSRSGYVSFQSLTVRSWIRCVLQMYVKNISEPGDLFSDTNPEQAVGK
jgi:hypothetical protein